MFQFIKKTVIRHFQKRAAYKEYQAALSLLYDRIDFYLTYQDDEDARGGAFNAIRFWEARAKLLKEAYEAI